MLKYLKNILAIENNNRLPVYDYIRCFATIFVLGIHQIGLDLSLNQQVQGTTLYNNLELIRWLFFASNMMFVMLSGALLLKYKEETILTYFAKRVSKVVIPLVIYFVVYYLYEVRNGIIPRVPFKTLIKWIVTADYYQIGAGHFWLMYTLLILYIAFVFMRKVLKNVSFNGLTIIGFISIALLVLTTGVTNDFLNNKIVEIILWCLAAVVGYWMTKDEARKYDYIILALGVVAIVINIVLYNHSPENRFLTSNLSPLKIFLAMGIFALFFKLRMSLKNIYIIRLLSKYSYGILLIHNLCLVYLHTKGLAVNSLMYNGFGCVIKLIVLLLISFIAAFIIDNTIAAAISAVFDLIFLRKKR